ncbi:MAG: hypothetical protein C0P65_004720 [Lysobacteraceae bacterium]|mgnify:CR=1 FL=1|jgi:Cell surface protein|nr:hypothetical protein [Xanthomonadaceae bacterium]
MRRLVLATPLLALLPLALLAGCDRRDTPEGTDAAVTSPAAQPPAGDTVPSADPAPAIPTDDTVPPSLPPPANDATTTPPTSTDPPGDVPDPAEDPRTPTGNP